MNRLRFAIASPGGDIEPADADLDLALEGCPLGVTYRAYFEAMASFLLGQGRDALRAAAAEVLGEPLPGPEEMVLRAEKHGALYHPASVEMAFPGGRAFTCGVLAAATPLARMILESEAGHLNRLRERLAEPLLPRVHATDLDGPLALALVEWFAGFHEFHVDKTGAVQLWEYGAGLRPLSAAQVRDLYGRAAEILGRCFDPGDGGRVSPWRHAAGDFVARAGDQGMAVRLTTVRDFGPAREGPHDPLAAAAGFVLETTLLMRLDRVDGVGEPAWLSRDCLEGAVEGVFAGLARQSDQAAALAADVRAALAAFTPEDLAAALAGAAGDCGPFYQDLLAARLPEHARELVAALRGEAARG